MKRLAILTGSLFFLGYHLALGSDQGGTSTAQFLRIGQGARAEGMGGAFTAVADDVYAISFNPAGLAQVTRKQIALNHLAYIEKINAQFGAFALPFNGVNGTLGFGFNYYNLGEIERRDNTGASIDGETKLGAYSAGLSWGQALGNSLAVGVTGKMFREDLAGEGKSGFAGDVGGFWFAVPNRLSLGVSALNVGPKLKVGTEDESLPLTLRGGLAFRAVPDALTLSVEAEKERDTDTIFHGGAEYKYRSFFFRGGYRSTLGIGGGLSAGVGFLWFPNSMGKDFFNQKDSGPEEGTSIRFDYSYVDYGDFDATHRFGVLVSF